MLAFVVFVWQWVLLPDWAHREESQHYNFHFSAPSSVVRLLDFYNRSSKIIVQEVSIDDRKLSNERETQVPSHRMYTLVLLEALIFIKIVSVSVMLFYVQYQIPHGPDSKLKLTAIGILNPLYTYGFFLLVWNNKLGKVHCNYQGVTGYHSQLNISFSEIFYVLNRLSKQCIPWCKASFCGISSEFSLFLGFISIKWVKIALKTS